MFVGCFNVTLCNDLCCNYCQILISCHRLVAVFTADIFGSCVQQDGQRVKSFSGDITETGVNSSNIKVLEVCWFWPMTKTKNINGSVNFIFKVLPSLPVLFNLIIATPIKLNAIIIIWTWQSIDLLQEMRSLILCHWNSINWWYIVNVHQCYCNFFQTDQLRWINFQYMWPI